MAQALCACASNFVLAHRLVDVREGHWALHGLRDICVVHIDEVSRLGGWVCVDG
jgi:hypothetical protein